MPTSCELSVGHQASWASLLTHSALIYSLVARSQEEKVAQSLFPRWGKGPFKGLREEASGYRSSLMEVGHGSREILNQELQLCD